ncbi:rhomboid family intramembrane serine protease [Hyphomicrobium sp.]|uniref:rhomboid family intramembrane serine protease n=1 Tax=Hyphomicrobium sp. TaxID=82 RepID=UPI002FDCABC6
MFVPLHDENSLKNIRYPWVTILLIAINVCVYFLETARLDELAIAGFAIIPKELFDTSLLPISVETVGPRFPERLTLLSYMFFHGDVLHLAGNMLFLWVFGDNVEDALGHLKYLVFYLACGVFGGLLHAWIDPTSEVPLIGASGAVAGVIAAYLVLHPRVRVWVLALKVIPLRISAAFALGLWILMQVAMVLLPQVGPVAWWAHIGGLMAGAVLVVFLRRRGVPLFDRGLRSPV